MSGKQSDSGSPLGGYPIKRNVGMKSKSQKNQEYFQALEHWLNDVRSFTFSCNFFAGLPYSMMNQQINTFPDMQSQTNNLIPPAPPFNQNFGMFVLPRPQMQQSHLDQGTEYKIPPLWKRFVAEYVDFLLLFFMKLFISVVAIDFFGFFDIDDFGILNKNSNTVDFKLAAGMTSGIKRILFLEVIHRIIVCIYEGIFLHKGAQNQVGGATPGKTLLGIKVILCYNVQQVGNDVNTVKVFPAANLGIGWSLGRAVLKNLVPALLFPIFLPLLFNKFRRTGYDILCRSIVVEDS